MKLRFWKLALIATAITSAAVVVAPAGSATAAPATPSIVLVNQPVHTLCSGHKFTVGVWYQAFSGGSRAYRISIWGPRRRRFFYRYGLASAKHWKFWKVTAGRRGRYRIVYSGHRPGSKKWSRYRIIIQARRCSRR